ncbi:MAG: 3-isopropylmalate dehydratase small subunit [bacterium]|nr:3-isopropylmalate dehydratase small subunit [bacterium]
MKPVRIISARGLPLDRSDVDTDQIIPSDWLKRVERTGFEQGLFSEWREDPSFVLNDPRFSDARILVAGPNFGTGSSREHAVWAIQQYGFSAVISPRFGDIFRNNATKNGLVPVQLEETAARKLLHAIVEDPSLEITVDVEQCVVTADAIGLQANFSLDGAVQKRLLEGLDDIGLTLAHSEAINRYEANRPAWLPVLS